MKKGPQIFLMYPPLLEFLVSLFLLFVMLGWLHLESLPCLNQYAVNMTGAHAVYKTNQCQCNTKCGSVYLVCVFYTKNLYKLRMTSLLLEYQGLNQHKNIVCEYSIASKVREIICIEFFFEICVIA